MWANSRVLGGSVRALSVLLAVQAWALAAQPVAAQIHSGANTKGVETKGAETKGAETKGAETKGAEAKGVEAKGAEASTAAGKEAVSPDSTAVKSTAKNKAGKDPSVKDPSGKDPSVKDPVAQEETAKPVKPVKPVSFDDYKKTVKAIDYKKYEVSLPELEKLIGKKGVYVLDLRSEREYNEGHIKGALHMGSDISEEKVARLLPNKDATAIIYCTNNFYPTRMLSLNNGCLPQFVTLGYKNVKVLQDLWQGSFDKSRDFMKGPLWVKEDDKTTAK